MLPEAQSDARTSPRKLSHPSPVVAVDVHFSRPLDKPTERTVPLFLATLTHPWDSQCLAMGRSDSILEPELARTSLA